MPTTDAGRVDRYIEADPRRFGLEGPSASGERQMLPRHTNRTAGFPATMRNLDYPVGKWPARAAEVKSA